MRAKIFMAAFIAGTLFMGCSSDSKKEVQSTTTETNSSVVVAQVAKAEVVVTESGNSLYNAKCASCHGSDAKGIADFPKLAGQNKADLLKKLNGYKDGSYGNKMKAVMEPNAKSLTKEQIEMLVDYIIKK